MTCSQYLVRLDPQTLAMLEKLSIHEADTITFWPVQTPSAAGNFQVSNSISAEMHVFY